MFHWIFQKDNLKCFLQLYPKEKPFICEMSSKNFSEKGSLKKHYCVLSKEKIFVRDKRSYRFACNKVLNIIFVCIKKKNSTVFEIHSKIFSRNGHLKQHYPDH